MVAYNFQSRFADQIRSGKKTHTVRRNSKRRHARKGERLQLYTGMRTKACAKILDIDPVCIDALPIEIVIDADSKWITSITIGGVPVRSLNRFARADGFISLAEMSGFFLAMHGPGVFRGTLIEWRAES